MGRVSKSQMTAESDDDNHPSLSQLSLLSAQVEEDLAVVRRRLGCPNVITNLNPPAPP